MTGRDTRLLRWLELFAELIAGARSTLQIDELGPRLLDLFDASTVSWNVRSATGDGGFEYWSRDDLGDVRERAQEWVRNDLDRHPLVQWYLKTGSSVPQVMNRVPRSIASQRDHDYISEILRPYRLQQQLSVPIVTRGRSHEAFVMCRDDDEYGSADLSLARAVQPALRSLVRQVDVCAPGGDRRIVRGQALFGLTGREQAVLVLLADGLKADAIARRLAASPRTVHKHLQHVYRKLGVPDRLLAVRVADEAGLLPDRSPSGFGGVTLTAHS